MRTKGNGSLTKINIERDGIWPLEGGGKKSDIVESGSLCLGFGIGAWFKVAVEFEFVTGGVKSSENCVDEHPKVIGVLEPGLKKTLSPGGEV